jgi:hypothetical protein
MRRVSSGSESQPPRAAPRITADAWVVQLLFECRSYTRRINQQALHSWRSVRIAFVARMPVITDLAVMATEQLGPDPSANGALGDFFLEFEDGSSERLADHLLRGELSSLEEPPTEPHPVTRTFPSPVLLRHLDEPVARVVQITATVAEAQADPMVIETPTAEIAWMLADTLTGSHTWFAADGRIWQTPSGQLFDLANGRLTH